MKIAVATNDFKKVTGHVGRCNGFLVYEIVDNKILSIEERENKFTNHKLSNDQKASHGHSHANLVNGLSDCSHLICTAAGWKLRDDFNNVGKEIIFTNEQIAEDAAIKFHLGTLEINPEAACHSH